MRTAIKVALFEGTTGIDESNFLADFSTWTVSKVTITSDAVEAPNGETEGDVMTGTSTVQNSKHIKTADGITASNCTYSVYAKAGTNDFIQILCSGDADAFCSFDIANGVVGTSGSEATGSVEDIGNGWYKCIVDFVGIISNGEMRIYLQDNNSGGFGAQSTADGYVYLWGAEATAL